MGRMGGYSIEKTAKKSIEEIISLFKSEELENIATHYTSTEMEIKDGNIRTDDPYSFKLSCVLPNWSSKFQNDRVRKLMEYVIKINTPAHLIVNFYWLDTEQMGDFEDIHQKWLAEKTKQDSNFATLDELSLALLAKIEHLQFAKNN